MDVLGFRENATARGRMPDGMVANPSAFMWLGEPALGSLRARCGKARKKERPRQEGEPAGAIKEGIYGAGSLAPINCF